MFRIITGVFVLLCSIAISPLKGELCGKVDAGPTVLYVDLLESGKTQKTLKMAGVKGDATVLVYQGLAIKPGVLFAWGKDSRVASGTLAVGYCLPITEKIKILPNVGMNWSYLVSYVDSKEHGFYNLRQRFRSQSEFIGMDFSYSLNPSFSFIFAYQYAWCKTDNRIGKTPFVQKFRSHSSGSNFSAGVEYYYNEHLAFNFGVGYNLSLSKEKHGIRGKGLKLGVAYYF